MTLTTCAAGEESGPRPEPLLIKHGWDLPSATFVGENSSRMDEMPFDGVVLRMDDGLSSKVQTQETINYEQFRSSLEPLEGVKLDNLRHNFLIVYSAPAGDIFDDWSVPLSNFKNMAQAAREAGFEGIFFDNEEYFGKAFSYPASCAGDRSLEECREQAYLRGSQVMEAIIAGWPDVTLIAAHGSYLSDHATSGYFSDHGIAWNNIADANEIRGYFTVGLAAGTQGEPAQFVDGGQVYAARSEKDFRSVRYWQQKGIAEHGEMIPEEIRSEWPDLVSSAFGVYDKPDLIGHTPMDVDVWGDTLSAALNITDRYVWAYTERYDWWGTGHPVTDVPPEWVDATVQSRNSASGIAQNDS